jgi:hypothetical protein
MPQSGGKRKRVPPPPTDPPPHNVLANAELREMLCAAAPDVLRRLDCTRVLHELAQTGRLASGKFDWLCTADEAVEHAQFLHDHITVDGLCDAARFAKLLDDTSMHPQLWAALQWMAGDCGCSFGDAVRRLRAANGEDGAERLRRLMGKRRVYVL